MLRSRFLTGLCVTAAALGATAVAPSVVAAHENGGQLERVRIFDDCDPPSFNAAVGPGTCVGDGRTTFRSFLNQLDRTGAVKGWEFKPSDVALDLGQGLHVVNRGGEFHTFTEVANFGGGCIPRLNRGQAPVPEANPCPPDGLPPGGVPAGGTRDVTGLGVGMHRFMCLIHPWMRTVVDVEADEH